MADVLEAKVVKEKYPALWKAASENGSPQTRTMGTVVGNILRASPSGDCCCAVLALGGRNPSWPKRDQRGPYRSVLA